MKRYLRYLILSIVLLTDSACSIFGPPTVQDETRGWSVERLLNEADLKLQERAYDKALLYYRNLEIRYPNHPYAIQAGLNIPYVHFKKEDPLSAIASADRFIKLHPNYPKIDYAYYVKGLASFTQRGIVEKITRQEINDRDPQMLRDSFFAFKELVKLYPKSEYAEDSKVRMLYLLNALAGHELHVAKYYMRRDAFIAAANRCKFAIENYPKAIDTEELLVVMISAYDAINADDLRDDAFRVLKLNFPNSKFSGNYAPLDKKTWWKFWESF